MEDSLRPGSGDKMWGAGKSLQGEKPLCVLLAEDDGAMRRLVTASLSRDGFDVVACSNGTELAALIERQIQGRAHPLIDAIVSDVDLPGRTGLECLRSVRRFDRKVPFIIVTAFCDKTTYEDAFRSGATAVFDKPFDLEELAKAIRRAVHSNQQA